MIVNSVLCKNGKDGEDLATGSLVRLHGVHLTLSHDLDRVEGRGVARGGRDDSLQYGDSVVRLCPRTGGLGPLAAPLLPGVAAP